MYKPSQELLQKYSNLLINFALNSGEGVKPGEVVMIVVDDIAKDFLLELRNTVLRAGAHPIVRMIPSGFDKSYFDIASDEQLEFFPEDYFKARTDLIDHQVGIISDVDPQELKDVDSQKIFQSMKNKKKYRDWLTDKENRGEFTWTLALYPTPAMAEEAGMSLEEFWHVVEDACYLDQENPLESWQNIFDEQNKVKSWLNNLDVDYFHIEAENIDLKIKIGEQRKWNGGSGRNIPSYEVFTSPDWRGTEGYIKFNTPLYRYGKLAEGVWLKFEKGLVVDCGADKGEDLVKEMVKQKNADKVGEFSLTDKDLSRIKKFTANTLFDENLGGPFGNMHIALGMAYKDCLDGDPSKLKANEWENLGFNDSNEHTDIISTEDKTVTAHLNDGTSKVVYKSGDFLI